MHFQPVRLLQRTNQEGQRLQQIAELQQLIQRQIRCRREDTMKRNQRDQIEHIVPHELPLLRSIVKPKNIITDKHAPDHTMQRHIPATDPITVIDKDQDHTDHRQNTDQDIIDQMLPFIQLHKKHLLPSRSPSNKESNYHPYSSQPRSPLPSRNYHNEPSSSLHVGRKPEDMPESSQQ